MVSARASGKAKTRRNMLTAIEKNRKPASTKVRSFNLGVKKESLKRDKMYE